MLDSESPKMEKPEFFKKPILRYLGGILNLSYSYCFYAYFWSNINSNEIVFTLLFLFLANILWIFIFYSLHLRNDKKNINEMRILMGVRSIIFLAGNAFQLYRDSFVLDISLSYYYIFFEILLSMAILIIDGSVYKKYKDY